MAKLAPPVKAFARCAPQEPICPSTILSLPDATKGRVWPKGRMQMIINDTESRGNGPDDGSVRLVMMAGALTVAAIFGAIYAELQVLVS